VNHGAARGYDLLGDPIMTPLFARWLYPRESRELEEDGKEP
jgi:hypothetical protein